MRNDVIRRESPPRGFPLAQEVARLLSCGEPRRGFDLGVQGIGREAADAGLCLITGACAYALGDPAAAEALWRKTVAIDPDAAQAHFNLGLLCAAAGRIGEAEGFYRSAIACDPENAGACCNLGVLLMREKRHEEAEQWFLAAAALKPASPDPHCNLGMLLALRGRTVEAEACYRLAIALDPGDAATHSNLGALLAGLGRDAEAEPCFLRAIALAPDRAGAYCNLGLLQARAGRAAEAEQSYRKAIALAPDRAEAHTNLGLLLDALDRDMEAERCHRQAAALDPGSPQIWSNLGNVLAKQERGGEAERCYRRALALEPGSPVAHANLGALFATLRREAEAERCLRQAIALDPDYPRARVNLGYLLLGQGRLAEGWEHHEARYHPRLCDRGTIPPGVSFPQWRGESLAGKSLLVWPEQGYGDEIQFCRYLPWLKEQGAGRITLACKAPLQPLLKTLSGVDAVIAAGRSADGIPAHDYWTFPLSLPLYCRTAGSTIRAGAPYLRAAPERLAYWASRVPREGFRVGLVWKGNHRNPNDADRSLPHLAMLAPLWDVPGVRFVSLQKGAAENEANAPGDRQPLLRLGAGIADFADSAAIVRLLDLVICVDTAVAHLAGALGRPCWALLPAYKTDWRWMQTRRDSPWYPGTMRLFRQKHRREWEPVIRRVVRALRQYVEAANRRVPCCRNAMAAAAMGEEAGGWPERAAWRCEAGRFSNPSVPFLP